MKGNICVAVMIVSCIFGIPYLLTKTLSGRESEELPVTTVTNTVYVTNYVPVKDFLTYGNGYADGLNTGMKELRKVFNGGTRSNSFYSALGIRTEITNAWNRYIKEFGE